MKILIFKKWWILTVKGLLLFLLGLLAFFLPEATILVLTTWFGLIILIGGIFSLTALLFFRKQLKEGWEGMLLLEGILDIAFGLFVLSFPKVTVEFVTLIIAFWLFIVGFFQIVNGFRFRNYIKRWWLFLINGLTTAALGVMIWYNPFEGSIALIYLIGTAAIFIGSMLIIISLFLRRWYNYTNQIQT